MCLFIVLVHSVRIYNVMKIKKNQYMRRCVQALVYSERETDINRDNVLEQYFNTFSNENIKFIR